MRSKEMPRPGLSTILLYIGLFGFIVTDVSFVLIKTTGGTTRLLLDGLSVFLILLAMRPRLYIRDVVVLIGILLIPVLSMVLTGNLKQSFIFLIVIFLSWIVSTAVCEKRFWTVYRHIMLLLTVVSLIALATFLVMPALIYRLPVAVSTSKYTVYNAFLAVIADNGALARNYGIFFEPGAFSIFLLIALFLEIFYFKTKIKYVLLYVVALITTYSTLGICCMVFLFAIALLHSKSIRNKYLRLSIIFLFLAATVYLAVAGDRFFYYIFGKIINMNVSATVRLNSIIIPLEEFAASPIFGIGHNSFLVMLEERCNGLATFTFINCFTIYGILWGFIPTVGCVRSLTGKVSKPLAKFLVVIFTILLFSTEAFEQVPFFYLLVFYGLRGKDREDETNHLVHRR